MSGVIYNFYRNITVNDSGLSCSYKPDDVGFTVSETP